MKKLFLFSFLISHSLLINAQTTIPAGNVSGTWTTAGSPYNINGDITVPNGQTLTINAGVTVSFQGHYKISVAGNIVAIGTQANKIIFTPVNTTAGWNGINFNYPSWSNDSSILNFSANSLLVIILSFYNLQR